MPTDAQTRILETLNPREPDEEVVARLRQMGQEAIDHPVWRDFRENGSKDFSCWEGDQWSASEKNELKERGQPDTVRNETKPIVERMLGQLANLYQTVGFIGRNTPDEQEGHAVSDMLRWSDQQNESEFEEGDATQDMIVCGFGVEEIDIDFDETGQPFITETYEDGFTDIFPDPHCRRYDWNAKHGARYIIKAPWVHIQDAIELIPDKALELRRCLESQQGSDFDFAGIDSTHLNTPHNLFVDRHKERLRLMEVWYKRKARRFSLLDEETGLVIPTSVPLGRREANRIIERLRGFSLHEFLVDEMWIGMLCGDVLLHHDRSPHTHGLFKWAPYYAWRKKNGEPYGIVRTLRPIQEAINKRESKALNMLSNRRIIAEKGASDDWNEIAEENVLADGILLFNDGAIRDKKVVIENNLDIGEPNVRLLESSLAAMESVSNQAGMALGLSKAIRSGEGVQKQQNVGNLSVSPIIRNLRRSRRIKAQIKLGLIQQYFTEDLVFQITDDPEKPKLVKVSATQLEKIRQKKFNLVMVDTTDHVTSRAEELQKMLNILPQLAALGPAWVDIGLRLSNLRDKEGLIKRVQEISKIPAPAPKMNMTFAYDKLVTAEERAMVWMMMEKPELAQFLLQEKPDSPVMLALKAKLAETQIKEGTRAMMERGKRDDRAAEIAERGVEQARQIEADILIEAANLESAERQAAAGAAAGGDA